MSDPIVDPQRDSLGLPRGTVKLHPPSPEWHAQYALEHAKLTQALAGLYSDIHHIGSTSIPEVPAKPILDIAVELAGPEATLAVVPRMESLGYVFRGAQGLDGRSYFVRGTETVSYVHVHMFAKRHETLLSYLNFRDHLTRDRAARERYVTGKLRLAAAHANDRPAYQVRKSALVREILADHDGAGPDSRLERETPVRANGNVYSSGHRVKDYQTDEYHALRLRLLESALSEALALQDGGHRTRQVLELGAGSPTLSLALVRRGFRVLATDGDAAVVEQLARAGLDASRVDVERPLPFAAEAFRGLVMGELIEHVFDTRCLLQDCWRSLSPGGVLAISTPNLTTLQDRLRFLVGRSPRQVSPLHAYLRLHIRPFCLHSLRETLTRTGFTDVRCLSNYVVWRWRDQQVFRSRSLARLAPQLGGSLIVTAVKGTSP